MQFRSATIRVTLLTPVMLAACTFSPLTDERIEYRPRTDAQPVQYPQNGAQPGPGESARVGAIVNGLALHQAIALTLLHSPDLADFAYNVRAAEAHVLQAGLGPNPQVRTSIENLGGPDDAGNTFKRTTVVLSQVIELAGKRRKRLSLADSSQRLAMWDYEDQRLQVVTEVTRRYIAVVAAQLRVEQALRSTRTVEKMQTIVNQRAAAGVIPTSARDKALVRVSVEGIELDRLTQQLEAARQTLAASWSGTTSDFGPADGTFPASTALPDKQVLLERARRHPRLARWADEYQHRQHALSLAQAYGVPDLSIGAGVRHFPNADDTAALIQFTVPLALFDRNQGHVLESRFKFAQADAQKKAAQADLQEEIARAYADAHSAQYAIQTLDGETLSAARSAFESAQEAFRMGQTDYLSVLDAERTLVNIQRQRIDALELFHTSVTSLEGLSGTPLMNQPSVQ